MADSGTYGPETIARHQRIAEQLALQATKPREIRSPLQGVGQLGEGLIAGIEGGRADKEEKQARKEAIAQALAAFGGGAPIAAPNAIPAAPAAAPGAPDPSMPATTLVGNNPDTSIPRGIRNNNALNIEAGPFTQGQPGFAGSDGRFAKFETPEQGTAAASALLDSYGRKGLNTPAGIIGRWAPAGDGNNVSAYAANVAKALGIGPNDPIPPEARPQLIAAMGQQENGRPIGNVAAALAQPAAGTPPQGAPPPAPVQVAQNAPVGPAGVQPQQGSRAAQIAAALNPWTPPAMQQAILGQLVPKPQAMKIQTRDGSDAIVFVDPVNKTVTDATGKPFSADSNGPPNPTLSGEDYLKTIPQGRRELISGMLEGRIGPAQLGRYGTKQVQSLLEDAARVEPNFDLTIWKGREAGVKDFYGGGKSQETVRKANQSALHFAELFADKADKLPGTQVPAFNAVANAVNSGLLGKDAAGNFEVNAHALADELAGLFKGAGISDSEIRAWESRISPNMSAAQQRGMAKTLLGLYRDSASALEKKRQDALGPTLAGKRAPVLGPEAEAALTRVEKFTGGQNISGGATGAPVKVASPEEARKLPKGTPIILPDGSPGVVP